MSRKTFLSSSSKIERAQSHSSGSEKIRSSSVETEVPLKPVQNGLNLYKNMIDIVASTSKYVHFPNNIES